MLKFYLKSLCILHVFCTSCQYLPNVSPEWRPNGTMLIQPIAFLLSASDILRGYPKYEINRLPLIKVIQKLEHNGTILIGVFGGSFTKGNGCTSHGRGHSASLHCSWHHRFAQWLRAAYPLGQVNIISYAIGSTTSMHGLHTLENEQENFDLVLFDYSCNDNFITGFDANDSHKDLLVTTEMIIRTVLNTSAALIYVSEYMASGDVSDTYNTVTKLYGIPHLNYRETALPLAKENQRTPFWASQSLSHVHPGWETHQCITDLVTSYWLAEASYLCSSNNYTITLLGNSSGLLSAVSPPQFYQEDQMLSRCRASRSFTTIPELQQFSGANELKPWKYSEDWVLKADVIGKPPGWIAQSTLATKEISYSPHIAFLFRLGQGIVSLTYLSTYSNAGKVEIWASRGENYGSNGGFRRKRLRSEPDDVILQYNGGERGYKESQISNAESYFRLPFAKAKQLYRHNQWVMETFTHSIFIESFDNRNNISELKETTLHFGISGEMLLHIRLANLSSAEIQRRGGDKFKLVSIRVC